MTQAKVNVLVVDDSRDKLIAMSAALAELNVNIVTAQSGREALRQLMLQEFAVVLLDVRMPEMDGFETAAMIRGRSSLGHLPIIFVTAYGDDTFAAQGYSLGAVDYILAPVVPEVLRAKVGVFVQLYRQHAQIKEQANQQVALAQEQAARETAEAANRMKDEFLAILSHELRTPLNVILGWAQLLKMGGQSDEDVSNGLEVIERNARAQAKIIEDLLDVSRIISGKFKLDLRPASVVEIVEGAISDLQGEAQAKGVQLEATFDAQLPVVEVDATRLQQVVWNLVSNAIKFTPSEGHILVSARYDRAGAEISVRDTGLGISPEFLPYVFDRFRQADASTTRTHGGLGLGLAIVRQLVEMHGGQISVASEGAGKGSTFTVRLPASEAELPPAEVSDANDQHEATPPPESTQKLRGARVLVVDDDHEARELVERILSRYEVQVRAAASADEAISILHEFRPDVLISDIGMPGRDGHGLLREIRRNHSASEIPALALTAYARPEERQKMFESGFQVHLAKPIDAAELLAIVSNLIQQPASSPLGGDHNTIVGPQPAPA